MGRKSLKEIRQKEIVKAFYKVAKNEGLENASIAKVAKLLEINPSLIIHYFKNKDELMIALIDYILERYHGIYKFEAEVISKDRLIEQIDLLFSRKWNRLFDDSVFYSCYALTYRNKKIKTRFKELHVVLRMYLAETLEGAVKNNVITIENSKETAELIYLLVEGAYYYCGIIDDTEETDRQLELCKNKVFSLLKFV